MKECSIIGCVEIVSELFESSVVRGKWIELRACQCGAWRQDKVCVCWQTEFPHGKPAIPTSYWPNLDWFALGGVDKVILCPRHKAEVLSEIVHQRGLDPSMNPGSAGKPDPSNRH